MRVGRFGASVVALGTVLLALTTGAAAAVPASARPGTKPAQPSGREARPWTLGGETCRLLSTAVAATADTAADGGDPCPGVRPGATVFTPVGQCTLNFLWHGSDGRDYIGTAGHCLLEQVRRAQVVHQPGEGPEARDGAGHRIGEFAYAALDMVSDFALIRLDPGVVASPEICRFGGPTGLNADPIPLLTPLSHVGHGSLTGSLAPARTQLASDGNDIRVLTGIGLASPGDSGSPVVGVDGQAVGVLVATGLTLPFLPTGLLVFSVRIAPEIGRAGAALGVGFELATAGLRVNLLQP